MDPNVDNTRNSTKTNFKGSLPYGQQPKELHYSPDGRYYFQMETFSKPINIIGTFGFDFFAKVEIFDNQNQEKIFETLNNYFGNYHQWLKIDSKDYLFFAEFRFGITVYNLTDKSQNSFLNEENSHHQIVQYFPSPEGLKLATVEYSLNELVICIYDISKPMELPYPIVFKKILEDNNGKFIHAIKWNSGIEIEIIRHEQIQICNYSIKVKVVGISDDKFSGICRLEDINGKEYFCKEKMECIGFLDENTIFPFDSSINVVLEKVYTFNEQKIAKIHINNDINIDVFEHQIETYWYRKNYSLHEKSIAKKIKQKK